jgi:AraC-like DNA-binding protein
MKNAVDLLPFVTQNDCIRQMESLCDKFLSQPNKRPLSSDERTALHSLRQKMNILLEMNNAYLCEIACDDTVMFSEIEAFIHENLGRGVTMSKACAHVYIGASKMDDLFKCNTGMTYRRYIHNLKMKVACRLLTETSLSLKAIASRVDFSSPQNFCRFFKAAIGVSPSEYRRNVAKNKSVLCDYYTI